MILLLACTDDVVEAKADTSPDPPDSDGSDDTGLTTVEGCRAAPAAAERERTLVFSLPYDERGRQSDLWGALALSTEGELAEVDEVQLFELGRATVGEARFTPDASIGVAPLEDGSIGVFALGEAGVEVIAASFDAGLYAGRVLPDPSGEGFWGIDGNWPENGGGVWWIPIDCDSGMPSAATRLVEAKLPADLLLAGERAMVVGRELPGSAAGADLAWLSWPDAGFVADADAFGDDEAIVSDATLTAGGGWALLADHSEFSGVPTRVARVAIDGDTLRAEGVVEVADPVALVAAPEAEAVLVVSGYENDMWVLDAESGALSSIAWSGASPQLPYAAVGLERGSLAGTVFVAEVEGIRQVHWEGATVVDDGLHGFGGGLEWIPGAVGVSP